MREEIKYNSQVLDSLRDSSYVVGGQLENSCDTSCDGDGSCDCDGAGCDCDE